jgi:transcriptional regulator with XRE-family HTH domain
MAVDSDDVLERRAYAIAEDHEQLLEQLIALRQTHGLSQAETARRMGVTQPAVAQFERHDANPTLATVRRYAMAVGAILETRVLDDAAGASDGVAYVGAVPRRSETIPAAAIDAENLW